MTLERTLEWKEPEVTHVFWKEVSIVRVGTSHGSGREISAMDIVFGKLFIYYLFNVKIVYVRKA